MNRLISTALAVALLFGLGALAVLARGGGDILAPADNAVAAAALPQTAAAPEAPTVASAWNAIALPLDMSATVQKADQLKTYIESFCTTPCAGGVEAVATWDGLGWKVRATGVTPNFSVYPGQALMVKIAPGVPINSFAVLGNVPPQCPSTGCIRNGVSTGLPALAATGWSYIMIPLDKSSLEGKKADDLKLDIDPGGNLTKVAVWDGLGWKVRATGVTPNFAIYLGYPYMVYANGISTTTWPNAWP
jgi:hypothetical protein